MVDTLGHANIGPNVVLKTLEKQKYISSYRPVVSVSSSPSSFSVRPAVSRRRRRRPLSVRPSRRPSRRLRRPSSDRPSRPVRPVVAVVVLCPTVPVRSVVVVRPLSVRPFARLITIYISFEKSEADEQFQFMNFLNMSSGVFALVTPFRV